MVSLEHLSFRETFNAAESVHRLIGLLQGAEGNLLFKLKKLHVDASFQSSADVRRFLLAAGQASILEQVSELQVKLRLPESEWTAFIGVCTLPRLRSKRAE